MYDGYYGADIAMEGGATSDSAGSDRGGDGAPSDYSSTNVQEAGVDEADIVKTDGEYLYIAQMDELTIVDAWPASEAAVVAHLPLGGWATGLYLHNDRAVVFSQVYDGGEGPFAYGTSRVSIVDVTDRANPEILREIDLSGWLTSSRLIGSDLYLVQNSYGALPDSLWSTLEGLESELPNPENYWDATEAERCALVSRVVPLADLIETAMTAAKKIAGLSPNAVKLTKEMVNAAYETPLSQGVMLERRLFHSLFAFEDQKEGMAAFVEKRKPVFTGR
jgi:uncharacterized secreted protein with C-terminal beta-propeller domain